MCPSDHMSDHDPSDHFDPSISSDANYSPHTPHHVGDGSDKLAAELKAANPEHLAQITNCGIAIREFMLSLMKVSRMDNGVMYGGFVMAVADIFPESFSELVRDVELLRSQLSDGAARSLPVQYVTAQDIRNGIASSSPVGTVLKRTGLGESLTDKLQTGVRRYTWGRQVQDLRKTLSAAVWEKRAAIEATIRGVIEAGTISWGIGWYDRWEKEVADTKAEISDPDKTPTPPKPTPGPFDKFNTAYPDRWPFGCDPTLCMIFHDLVTARHYTTSFTDVTPNVIIKRIHWALNNCRRSWALTDHPQGWTLPWSADEMRRTLDEMFKVPSLPSGIQKNLCSLTQIFDIYLAQQDTVAKLCKYDMDIANARSAKDRIVARDEKFILWASSNKSWGDDWTKLFEYDLTTYLVLRARMEKEVKEGKTVAAREDAMIEDLKRRGIYASQTAEAFRKEREIMNLTSASTDTDDLVELMKLHDDLYGPNWRQPFISDHYAANTAYRDPIEPHLLSDADRDAMIPKQTSYDPNA